MSKRDLIIRNLRVLKEIENLTEKEFAARIGNIPRSNMSKYLSRSIPPPEIIRTISVEFDLDIHKLFCVELTRSNYQEFKLENQKTKIENLNFEALNSIKKNLDILLDKSVTDELRQNASSQLVEELEVVIKSASEFHNMRERLFKYLQKESII